MTSKQSPKNKPVTRKKKVRRRTINWQEVKSWVLLLLIGLVLYFLARPAVEEIIVSNIDSGATVPPGNWKYGVDLSHHNDGKILWDSLFVMTDARGRTVRNLEDACEVQPVSFVFMKATEGVSHKDRRFASRWKEAGQYPLSRGAYHFYRTSKDPAAQAQHFIRTVGSLKYRDLPPVLDIETLHGGCTKEKLNADLAVWLETVEKHYGKRPIVYTYETFARDFLLPSITEKYPIWIAHYDVRRPQRKDWGYWQFTDKAVVHGINGLVDLNVMQ